VQQQRSILLAEPDNRLRATWRAGLVGMGFHVLESSDGAGALSMSLRSEVALLVTELYVASGAQRCLVRAVRREPGLQRLKILVVSAHDTAEDRQWALTSGADAYLVKPVPLGRMLQLSAQLANSRQQSRGVSRSAATRERT